MPPVFPQAVVPRTALTIRRVTKILAKHKELLTKKEWVCRRVRAALCGILNPPPPLRVSWIRVRPRLTGCP